MVNEYVIIHKQHLIEMLEGMTGITDDEFIRDEDHQIKRMCNSSTLNSEVMLSAINYREMDTGKVHGNRLAIAIISKGGIEDGEGNKI